MLVHQVDDLHIKASIRKEIDGLTTLRFNEVDPISRSTSTDVFGEQTKCSPIERPQRHSPLNGVLDSTSIEGQTIQRVEEPLLLVIVEVPLVFGPE